MKDLGITRKELWGTSYGAPCSPEDSDSTLVYPELSLAPKQAQAAGLSGISFGDEITLTIKARVVSISESDNSGPNIRLEVQAVEPEKETGGLAERYNRA